VPQPASAAATIRAAAALIHKLLFFKILYLDDSAERTADSVRGRGVNHFDGGFRFISLTAKTCGRNRFLHYL
jgi:hypothetical protein